MSDERRRRTVRSFVRRAGRMTSSQAKAWQALWPRYGVDPGEAAIDFAALFGREAPVVLELGFGSGDSLVDLAAASPDADFVGIEVHEPGIGHCMIAAREAGIDNLRLICGDGVEVLRRNVAPGSLARFNLYFADPWPKKRHHKRRIVQPAFVELVARALAPGGDFYLATDWAPYAAHIDAVLADAGNAGDFDCIERREHDGSRPLARPATRFERRGLRHGHNIVDWHFRRRT